MGVGGYSRPPCKASFLRIPLLSSPLAPFPFPTSSSFSLSCPLCLSAQTASLSPALPLSAASLPSPELLFFLLIRARCACFLFSPVFPPPVSFPVHRCVAYRLIRIRASLGIRWNGGPVRVFRFIPGLVRFDRTAFPPFLRRDKIREGERGEREKRVVPSSSVRRSVRVRSSVPTTWTRRTESRRISRIR